MGSIFHLDIIDEVQVESLSKLKYMGYKLVVADTSGDGIYNFKLSDKIIIAFANETVGPSENLLEKSDYKVTVPRIGKAESLNVAAASAVILSELTKFN
jgi:TrmH family RNA methyltransferase